MFDKEISESLPLLQVIFCTECPVPLSPLWNPSRAVVSGKRSPWKCLCIGGVGIILGFGEETWIWLCQLSLGGPRTQSEREGRAICPGLARHIVLGSIPQACLPGVSSQPWLCADSTCSQFASHACSSRLQAAMIASLEVLLLGCSGVCLDFFAHVPVSSSLTSRASCQPRSHSG